MALTVNGGRVKGLQGENGRGGRHPNLKDEDQELLAKLEAANRELEMDEKSCPSLVALSPTPPGHSRKGSGSSLQSTTSSNSAFSNQLSTDAEEAVSNPHEPLWEIWGRIVNDWDNVKKKTSYLKDLVRRGIPHEFRGIAWQLLLGVHDSPSKHLYAEYMKKTSPCEKLIRRDIARTFPDHDFFKEKDGFGQESLFNVMKAYSLHDREVGYCQGSGFIVGLLLMQMPEEDAFAVLVKLMQEYRLRELFKPSMAELGVCMFKLEFFIQELLPTLMVHFHTQNFDTSMYASSWFLTLFTTSLPLSLARRVMDLFISEGMEMVFRIAVAILQTCQEDLLALDMEGLVQYLQKDLRSRFESDIDQELLLHAAFHVRYNSKKLKKLEKNYTALKSKENEEQVELRRLRTENRLLRQRIENLEKVEAKLIRQHEESAALADRLIQDQVTRAQEAEEMYSLRSQLSVTKQLLLDTTKKLVEAQDIIGDVRQRTSIIQGAVRLDDDEEKNMVQHLQDELIAVRLREAETISVIKELKTKIRELEDSNLRLQHSPSNDVQHLQEELIAVKLREAEANLSLKELKQKVKEIECYWESHMERMATGGGPKEKNSKAEIRHLQEEVMTVKIKEARAVADLKETKQKVMELETQNQICQNQIRRMNEENKSLQQKIDEAMEREKDLKASIKDLGRKLDNLETERKEDTMMARIKEAESVQIIAELRHRIAEIDIQREELLTEDRLQNKSDKEELENQIYDLQDEMIQLQMATPRSTNHPLPAANRDSVMTASFLTVHDSDDDWDVEVRDSENLDRTLSDIIEGRSPFTTPHKDLPRFNSLDKLAEPEGDRGRGVRGDGGEGGGVFGEELTRDGIVNPASLPVSSSISASVMGSEEVSRWLDASASSLSLPLSSPNSSQGMDRALSDCLMLEGRAFGGDGMENSATKAGGGPYEQDGACMPVGASEVEVCVGCDENFNMQSVSKTMSASSLPASCVFKTLNGDAVALTTSAPGGDSDADK